MSMVMILIPLSLLLVGVAVWGFMWAVNSGQFDDLDTPGWDILTDESVSNKQHEIATQASSSSMANIEP